jgi:hypothetical protein
LRRAKINHRGEPKALADYDHNQVVAIFLASLYFKASAFMVRKLQKLKNPVPTIQRWLDTADGVVLPYLLEAEEPDHQVVNALTRFALESCANNYARFVSRLKARKKEIRKCLALDIDIPFQRDMATYTRVYLATAPKVSSKWPCPSENLHAHGIHTNLWCQTRGVGLADNTMGEQALGKFYDTVRMEDIKLQEFDALRDPVRQATLCVRSARGIHAHISAGPKASLEKTQAQGGHTQHLSDVVRTRVVKYRYDPVTLERTPARRKIGTSRDVLDYCVEWVLENPILRRVVKPHVVLEPSKARVITISPWAVSRLQGVVAHLLAPCLRQAFQTKSGMTKDRHLWRFFKNLHPQDTNWQHAMGRPVLSTDWSEATDHFSRRFAKTIWREILRHLQKVPDAPIGLVKLAATLHCEERYVLRKVEGAAGPERFHSEPIRTRRGIFMGDYLTKIILTFGQDICARGAGLKVYSVVGDDFVAFGDRANLLAYLDLVRMTGGRISEEDTYISERYIFYCEEMAIVPWTTPDLPVVQYKRGSSKMNYLDCPRIRLLLPVTTETLGFSDVNIGKFSLLGKEARWVASTHKDLRSLYNRAVLLQHIQLRQDADTMCPFVPVEIGGDGSFLEDAEFFTRVTKLKARDPVEIQYRIGNLYRGREGFRYVRSDTLNQVTHRYTARLPILRKLRQYLPPEMVVPIDESNSSIRSLQVRGLLESPEHTILRMVKEMYYREILRGAEVGSLPTNPFEGIVKRREDLGGSKPLFTSPTRFLAHWKCPGFRYENIGDFLVRQDLAPMVDHLSLAWTFGRERPVSQDKIFAEWLASSGCLQDSLSEDLLHHLVAREDLPEAIRGRLHLFIESDSVIKEQFVRHLPDPQKGEPVPPPPMGGKILLVSTDQNLAADLVRLGHARGQDYQVTCLRPAFWLYGRAYEVLDPDDYQVIEDPGSMFYEDVAYFSEGDPPTWIEDPIRIRKAYRHESVWVADRQKPTSRGA